MRGDSMNWKNSTQWGWLLVMSLVCVLFFSLMVSSLGFLVGLSMGRWVVLIVLGLWFLSLGLICSREGGGLKIIVKLALVSSVIVGGSLWVAGQFWDVSYDGRGYHMSTIRKLTEGWNPVKTELSIEATPGQPWWQWINVYPKGVEQVQTVANLATGNIETGKGINLVMAVVSFILLVSFLVRFRIVKGWQAAVIAGVVVMNPVAVTQWLTFYNDGVLYYVILSMVTSLGMVVLFREKRWLLPAIVLWSMVWSIKMTGVVYGSLVWLVYWILTWKKLNLQRHLFYGFLVGIGVGVVLSVNPYLTNLLRSGNPFYFPVSVEQIVRNNLADNLVSRTVAERLLISSFSRSSGERGRGNDALLKWPWQVSKTEFVAYRKPDVLVGGWGPVFAGALGVAMVLLWLMAALGSGERAFRVTAQVAGGLLLACLLNGAASYARYVPWWWLWPVVVAFGANKMKNRWLKVLSILIWTIMILNIVMVVWTNWGYNWENRNLTGINIEGIEYKFD